MAKLFIILGAINSALAVGLGAFGAHGLKSRLSERLIDTYKTGVDYHIIHALGLIMVGIIILLTQTRNDLIQWSGWLLLAGIVLFSGSLYVLSLTGIKTFGAITPFGGLSFIVGWILLAVGIYRSLV